MTSGIADSSQSGLADNAAAFDQFCHETVLQLAIQRGIQELTKEWLAKNCMFASPDKAHMNDGDDRRDALEDLAIMLGDDIVKESGLANLSADQLRLLQLAIADALADARRAWEEDRRGKGTQPSVDEQQTSSRESEGGDGVHRTLDAEGEYLACANELERLLGRNAADMGLRRLENDELATLLDAIIELAEGINANATVPAPLPLRDAIGGLPRVTPEQWVRKNCGGLKSRTPACH